MHSIFESGSIQTLVLATAELREACLSSQAVQIKKRGYHKNKMCIKKLAEFVFLWGAIAPIYSFASEHCQESVAKVLSTQGRVEVQASGSTGWRRIRDDDMLCDGDVVHTFRWSRVTIVRPSGSGFTMSQNGTLTVTSPPEATSQSQQKAAWYIKLLQGAAFFRSRQPERFSIQTPFINAVHKGTEFLVDVSGESAEISVFDGQVEGKNAAGTVNIGKGNKGIARPGRAPQVRTLTIAPEDAVQWALYYPTIIDDNRTGVNELDAVLAAYRDGDLQTALDRLDGMPSGRENNRYLTLKAALFLSVGSVEDSQTLIDRVLSMSSRDSEALALKAVIAVAKNRPQQAMQLAQQAVDSDRESLVALMAQSYAYQALFDVESALKAAIQATVLKPHHALAWARVAELALSQGDKNTALEAARKAQTLNPKLARTESVLGFAYLAESATGQALGAFNHAAALDPADPVPRLGIALAKIRQGDIESGKTDLENAVDLDPNNSILRSYLGKAYYELKNETFAAKELEIAKASDPKDPTPYFYDAILKQTVNRPVEALRSMQKAIELNDNRAVYRSRLLLDRDLAARSAAQGRIYHELGFQQQGLLEGWKSVNQDAGNYSAHRLLADNYAALPRHEFARVSELLQSQLLQPVNITPIQPNLGESNLFILNGLGPSDLSYNEYNPLFEYNRNAVQASGFVGGRNTYSDNAAVSGLYGNHSFSLGQFHYETDGFRKNNFFETDVYNVFLQSQLTHDLNLQAEFRYEERENGDLSQNFFSNVFSRDFKKKTDVESYRIGGRYEIDQNSSIIGSLIYQNIRDKRQQTVFDEDLGNYLSQTRLNEKSYIGDIQHHFANSALSTLNGFSHINQTALQQDFEPSPEPVFDTSLRKSAFYDYTKVNITKQLRATLGVSFDFFNLGDFLEQNRVHPKLGLEWLPNSATTVRAAAFRNTSISRIASQTLEPTQVAGFNQFFDDNNGTVAWRYGAGVDHKFSESVAAGLEYSERQLNLPGEEAGRSEQLARAYVNYTPFDYCALNGEYFYERIDQSEGALTVNRGLFQLAETHRFPLTLSLFHPSGLSFKIKNTFVHQSGLFANLYPGRLPVASVAGNANYFVIDMNLSYRLPKRFGIISVGVNNLLDEQFNFQNTNINSNQSMLAPGRIVFSRFTLAF